MFIHTLLYFLLIILLVIDLMLHNNI